MNTHTGPRPVSHEAARQQLPWLSAADLAEPRHAALRAHVAACPECRRDLAMQESLRAAALPNDAALDADRALAKLMPRLGPQERPVSSLTRWRGAAAANGAWLRWTAAAQFLIIVALAGMLARPDADPGDAAGHPAGQQSADYRALGGARPVQGELALVLRPGTPEAEMRRILLANGARVVDGPTAAGAWVLALPAPQAAGALARLRAEPAVALVQPLGAGSPP